MELVKTLSEELNITTKQVEAVIELIEEGNTIPFIARYRKEKHGSLDDEILRDFEVRYNYLLNFSQRLETIIKSIEEQEKMTPELLNELNACKTLSELEDIYRPYKPKKKTKASIAKEKGLDPLAQYMISLDDSKDFIEFASSFINPEKKVETVEDAINGAKDIIAEEVSDNAKFRKHIRENYQKYGKILTKENPKNPNPIFEMYKDYQEPIAKIANHRVLAINRGERVGALKVSLDTPDIETIEYIKRSLITKDVSYKEHYAAAIEDSYKRLIAPSIENEIRNQLTEDAEDSSIDVFKANLKELLLESPTKNKVVLGFDPAFRTGCKLAIVNQLGDVLYKGVIYPTAPQNKVNEAKELLKQAISKYKVDLISLGNGTASRESEVIIKELLEEINNPNLSYVITNEAGASVYSASKLGTEEFPDFDVALRSAVSLARRVQDPLAELVKIDPKSIGVGQYQHDMNQKKLSEALGTTVIDCVNSVGVDVNLASPSLLQYVSGINATIAKNIVAYRQANRGFKTRDELLKVAKLGQKAYQQCAGFLRISDQKNPLDNTGVHPESYQVTFKLLELLKINVLELGKPETTEKLSRVNVEETAKTLNVGEPTLKDIIEELKKPGRDIRDLSKKVTLRHDITDIKDLKENMVLEGTVRNIMDFGAFVDIGVHQDGLVHISQIADRYIKHPLEALKIGQIVKVKVIGVDVEKKRISLSIKQVNN